jgi:hypothetical protein
MADNITDAAVVDLIVAEPSAKLPPRAQGEELSQFDKMHISRQPTLSLPSAHFSYWSSESGRDEDSRGHRDDTTQMDFHA